MKQEAKTVSSEALEMTARRLWTTRISLGQPTGIH